MPKKVDTKDRRAAIAAVDSGTPRRDVAAKYGVSEMTIGRWVKERDRGGARTIADRAAALPTIPDAPDEAPADDVDPSDTLGFLKQMVTDTQRRIRLSERQGNLAAAQKMGRDLGGLLNTVARVERLERSEEELIRITREQLVEAKASVLAKVHALADRPLHCAECARKLSVRWGREGRANVKDDG
jgi:aryl-alcohol dehydrogenase-like predicted oxidoreductase